MTTQNTTKSVDAIRHGEDTRKNIPSAEQQSFIQKERQSPKQLRYPRNTDLDPQLVWRGKDDQDGKDLVVNAPALYIQEKVHPKVLIDDLLKTTAERVSQASQDTPDLFSDFNGIPLGADKTEFYQHDQKWTNRMILGDSLQVMASLMEREALRSQVQTIYFDPPYGIKFNSNFQWSTTGRESQGESAVHITREPEQVKAFRDTWRDGIHSYLTYLRDRFILAHDLLAPSGSIFVQISNENMHRVRAVLDEIFGDENCVATIAYKKASPETRTIKNSFNYILWYAKDKDHLKVKKMYRERSMADGSTEDPKKLALWLVQPNGDERTLSTDEKRSDVPLPAGARVFRADKVRDAGKIDGRDFTFAFRGESLSPGPRHCWRGDPSEMARLLRANRLLRTSESLAYKYFIDDNWGVERTNYWEDTAGKIHDMRYVVETNEKIVARCLQMTSDPGDLVLDPTCGSGTTAFVAEQLGRRWITVDTSRVALALARARIMGARFPFFLLADSREGQLKEAEITRTAPSSQPVRGDVRHGFVYARVPHITLKSIANNAEIDVIWEKWQATMAPLLASLNTSLNSDWNEWDIPRKAADEWSEKAKRFHASWWSGQRSRQLEIDASIAAKAEFKYLYDRPYENSRCVRVAGPFTVESLSPHRMLGLDVDEELIGSIDHGQSDYGSKQSFAQMILENLKTAGVQQAHKEGRITFTSLTAWPGEGAVCAEGRYLEGEVEKRAGIFIGPEFGTVQRSDLVEAARECGDADFDVLIACAFNYDAHATEFSKLGRIPVLKARMNADLHMAEDLKNTGRGNMFVIFGEPDIDILGRDGRNARLVEDGKETYRIDDGEKIVIKVNGVDIFKPQTGEVISDGAAGIACWFIDTDYNQESFFVRQAYFLGTNDPYSALKSTLRTEIDSESWSTLNSDTSRPFDKPRNGRIAVKIINHLGDEVMKVYKV